MNIKRKNKSVVTMYITMNLQNDNRTHATRVASNRSPFEQREYEPKKELTFSSLNNWWQRILALILCKERGICFVTYCYFHLHTCKCRWGLQDTELRRWEEQYLISADGKTTYNTNKSLRKDCSSVPFLGNIQLTQKVTSSNTLTVERQPTKEGIMEREKHHLEIVIMVAGKRSCQWRSMNRMSVTSEQVLQSN